MLTEVSQAEQDEYCKLSLIRGIFKTKQKMNKQQKQTHSLTEQAGDCPRGGECGMGGKVKSKDRYQLLI